MVEHCEVCGKPLTLADISVEAVMHEDCWKAVVDKERHDVVKSGLYGGDFITDPIYLSDGRRAMELLNDIPTRT